MNVFLTLKGGIMIQKNFLPVDYIVVSALANLSDNISEIPTIKPLLHNAFYTMRKR